MSHTKRYRKNQGSVVTLVTLAIGLLLSLFVLLNRQAVIDQFTVWQYRPSFEIGTLVDRSGMNPKGQFYFYSGRPSLESAQAFNDKCGRKEQGTAILGCYADRLIYVYNVSDQKLDGIREVTAAHEMLHAVYDRMSDTERSKLSTLLEAEYEKLKSNADFAERMAFYERTEPGERDNELHSVIGTEVAAISSELEQHYGQYFGDRRKVVALYEKYEAVFNDLKVRGKQLSDQITKLGDTIEAESAQYNTDVTQLNQEVKEFNARAKSGAFADSATFQAERSALIARSDQLDARQAAIKNDIARYNALREELKLVAGQSEALNRSIDSTLAPAPSV